MYSEADSECDRREKGHWEIERDSVCVLTWCKRDSWLEFDPDKDRKQISMSVLECSVDECRLLVLQMRKKEKKPETILHLQFLVCLITHHS